MDDDKEKTEGKEEGQDRSRSNSSNFIPSVSDPKDAWLREQILKTRLKKKKNKKEIK
jgi:hypothetical protein